MVLNLKEVLVNKRLMGVVLITMLPLLGMSCTQPSSAGAVSVLPLNDISTVNKLANDSAELIDIAYRCIDEFRVKDELTSRYPDTVDWSIEVEHAKFYSNENVYLFNYRFINTDVTFAMFVSSEDEYVLTKPVNQYHKDNHWVLFTNGVPVNSIVIYDRIPSTHSEDTVVYTSDYVYGDDTAVLQSKDHGTVGINLKNQ